MMPIVMHCLEHTMNHKPSQHHLHSHAPVGGVLNDAHLHALAKGPPELLVLRWMGQEWVRLGLTRAGSSSMQNIPQPQEPSNSLKPAQGSLPATATEGPRAA